MGKGHPWFVVSPGLDTVYGLQSRCSKQAERNKEGRREGGREGGREGVSTDPEFRAFIELSSLPSSQTMPSAHEVTGVTKALAGFCPGSLPLTGSSLEGALWRPGHWTQGEEADRVAFGSEIAACRFPDDSSTTAGLLPDPSDLPPLKGGDQETDLHQIPINTPGRIPWWCLFPRVKQRDWP